MSGPPPSFVSYLVPFGDDGRQAALIPPRVCALLWSRFGTELERLRKDHADDEAGMVLYALHASGATHQAATADRASPSGRDRASAAEPRRTSAKSAGDPPPPGREVRLRREFSTNEVAERLGVGDRRVRQLREQGQLIGRRVGRDWRYDETGVETLAEQRSESG
jgi:excisionase family DNA binding protein